MHVRFLHLLSMLLFCTFARAQSEADSMARQVDLYDVLAKVSKHLEFRRDDTVKKQVGKVYLSVLPVVAYSIQTGMVGGVGGNLAFYTSEGEKANISNVTYMAVYTVKKQTVFITQPNIWGKDNKYNLIGSIAYLKFPQETYGLGGHSTFDEVTSVTYSYLRIYQTLLRQVLPDFFAGGGYNLDYHYKIKESFNPLENPSDFEEYGRPSRSVNSGFNITALHDTRRNSINPQKGVFLKLEYRNNLKVMASDNNSQSLIADARKYFKIPAASENILALWSYNWFTLRGNPPFLDLPSTTWDGEASTGRGYAQSRYRGKNLIYQEVEYRFRILNNGFLGGVVYVNAQTFSEWPVNKYEVIIPGYGLGVRIKVNKYSRTNLGIDYGWGVGGSKGFFVNLCEMF